MDWDNIFNEKKKEPEVVPIEQDWGDIFNQVKKPEKVVDNKPHSMADAFSDAFAPKEPTKPCLYDDAFSKSSTPVLATPEIAKRDWDAVAFKEPIAVEQKQEIIQQTVFDMHNPIEKLLLAINPRVDLQNADAWIKNYDVCFQQLADWTDEISHNMLDMSQDMARVHSDQDAVFNAIKNMMRTMDEAVNPPVQKTGFLGKLLGAAPKEPEKMDIHGFIDALQEDMRSLKIELDPFLDNNIQALKDDIAAFNQQLECCKTALEYLKKHGGLADDIYNRRYTRIQAIAQMSQLSELSMTQLNAQMESRTERLQDFKGQAVPMVVIKLQQFIISKDIASLKGAFAPILSMTLE